MKIQAVLKFLRVAASAAVMLGVSVVASGYAHASSIITIDFDDLPGDESSIPNGYSGFNWSSFGALNATTYGGNPSGYLNGQVSPDNVAFNRFEADASFSAVTAFDFFGGYFTAAWNDGLQIVVKGFLGGLETHSQTIFVNTSFPSLIGFNWFGVDKVTFSSSGGIPNEDLNGGGTHFALDNLQVSPVSAVPVPAALPLFASAIGLGGLFAARRRKQNAA